MKNGTRISNRVSQIAKSAIHEMMILSKEIDDVVFLVWAKSTAGVPVHIREGAISAIRNGHVEGYSEIAARVSLLVKQMLEAKQLVHIECNDEEYMFPGRFVREVKLAEV